mgnify:CR=1 FL=1
MAVLDLGKVTKTDEEIKEIIDEKLHGYSFYENPEVIYLVAEDTPYQDDNGKYILASGPTGQTLIQDSTIYKIASLKGNYYSVGADALSPFKQGNASSPIGSPLIMPINLDIETVTTATSEIEIPFGIHNPSKLVMRTLQLGGYNGSKSARSQTIRVNIYGTKEDGTVSIIKGFVQSIETTSWAYRKFNDYEVDLSGFKSVEKMVITKPSVVSSQYSMRFTVNGSVELYF